MVERLKNFKENPDESVDIVKAKVTNEDTFAWFTINKDMKTK